MTAEVRRPDPGCDTGRRPGGRRDRKWRGSDGQGSLVASVVVIVAAVVVAASRHNHIQGSVLPWAAVLAAGGVLYAWSSGRIALRLAGPRPASDVRRFRQRMYRNMAGMAAMGIAIGILAAAFRAAWVDILTAVVMVIMWVIAVLMGLRLARKRSERDDGAGSSS